MINHAAVVDALAIALARSTTPKSDLGWTAPGWRPEVHLWGSGIAAGPGELARAGMVALASEPGIDDEEAVRLYCGALLHLVAEARDVTDVDDPRRAMQAAGVLLGLYPRSFYAALEDSDGVEVWEPIGRSRTDIRIRLEARLEDRGNRKQISWFDRHCNPDQVGTRRVLVSFLLTDGERSYDNWTTEKKARVRELAAAIHSAVSAALGDAEYRGSLIRQLPANSFIESDSEPVDLYYACAVDPPITTASATAAAADATTPRRRRTAVLRAHGRSRVPVLAAAIALVATVATFGALGELNGGPGLNAAATTARAPEGSEAAADDPTTPLVGRLLVRKLDRATPAADRLVRWHEDVVLGDRLELQLHVRNPTDSPVADVAVQIQADSPPDGMPGPVAEELVVRLMTPDTDGHFMIPLDETPPTPAKTDAPSIGVTPAHVYLGPPDTGYDGCSTAGIFRADTDGAQLTRGSELAYVDESWDLPEGRDGWPRPVARHWLGTIAPNETVKLRIRGAFDLTDTSEGVLSYGENLDVGVNDNEWTKLDAARLGDTVTTLLQIHDSSCSTKKTPYVFRLRTRTNARAVVTLTASAGTDDLGTSRINLVGSKAARLVPVPGSTRLYGYRVIGLGTPSARCTERPVKLGPLSDGITQAGVQVLLAGYVPREPCDSHLRWVMTDFRVVAP